MDEILVFADSLSVGIFGILLSAAFCRAYATWRGRVGIGIGLGLLLILSGGLYNMLGEARWETL